MFYRHLILLLIATSLIHAGEDNRREKLRSELKEASKELERFSRAVNLIHELVAPSVVSIHTKEQRIYTNVRSREWTKREVEVGEGSGFVFHSDEQASWIITNAHVVVQTNNEQEFVAGPDGKLVTYDRVQVVLSDNRELEAEYVGVYVESDLAVLKVKMPHLPALDWDDSDQTKVGDWVVALGYPLGIGYSATSGIVSATDRSIGIYQSIRGFDSFIQTDAAINPGNSGGPLVDSRGRVIGINASIKSSTGANIGLGFAIPANLARRVADDLRVHGKVRRPMVGITMDDLTADKAKALGLTQTQAVLVTGIVPHGPAGKAGMEVGDVILAINQARIVSIQQFQSRVASSTLEQPITLRLWRAGKEIEQVVTPISADEIQAKLDAATKTTALQQGVPISGFGLWATTDDQAGLSITSVEAGSIAERAKLKPGDRLMRERTHGQLRTTADATALSEQRDLTLQIYQDGRSYWLRLKR